MGTRKLMTTGWMREEMMKVIELYYFNQNVVERRHDSCRICDRACLAIFHKVCSFSKFVYTIKKEKGAKVYAGGKVSGFEI